MRHDATRRGETRREKAGPGRRHPFPAALPVSLIVSHTLTRCEGSSPRGSQRAQAS